MRHYVYMSCWRQEYDEYDVSVFQIIPLQKAREVTSFCVGLSEFISETHQDIHKKVISSIKGECDEQFFVEELTFEETPANLP